METWEMCFILSMNRRKEYYEKALRSARKLEHCMETWVNTSRVKNIMKKHLRSARKLVTEQEKEDCMESVFRSLGEYVKAKEYYEKALVISTEIGDRGRRNTVWKPGKCVSFSR